MENTAAAGKPEVVVSGSAIEVEQVKEARKQTQLLVSINGKLNFMVFVLVIYIGLSIVGLLFR